MHSVKQCNIVHTCGIQKYLKYVVYTHQKNMLISDIFYYYKCDLRFYMIFLITLHFHLHDTDPGAQATSRMTKLERAQLLIPSGVAT